MGKDTKAEELRAAAAGLCFYSIRYPTGELQHVSPAFPLFSPVAEALLSPCPRPGPRLLQDTCRHQPCTAQRSEVPSRARREATNIRGVSVGHLRWSLCGHVTAEAAAKHTKETNSGLCTSLYGSRHSINSS